MTFRDIKDRENIQRAIGIIEGVSNCTDDNISRALVCAVEIIDEVLNNSPTPTERDS